MRLHTRSKRLLTLSIALGAASVLLFAACGSSTSDADKTATAKAGAPTAASTSSSSSTKPAGSATTGASGSKIPADVGKADSAQLTGAGSTFANPLYTRWASDYQTKVSSKVQVNYQSVGSGAGIQSLTAQTVDFGATDAPMSDADEAKAPGAVQHIPTALGAVVVTYNLSGVTAPLKLDGPTLAQIFLGKITKWNDPAIAALNAGVTLPGADIVVVHRSDGSGTSFIFTDYLSNVSPDWKAGPGTSKNPSWPVGLGGQGNEGVTQQVKQNSNSIGYVELGYATTNSLPFADLKNKSGEFITPNTASTSGAAAGVTIPADYRVSIVDSPTKGAYPIVGFTWIVLYKDQKDAVKGKALIDWIWWGIHDGQSVEASLGYAPLPADVVTSLEKTLTTDITSGGQPLLKAQ